MPSSLPIPSTLKPKAAGQICLLRDKFHSKELSLSRKKQKS